MLLLLVQLVRAPVGENILFQSSELLDSIVPVLSQVGNTVLAAVDAAEGGQSLLFFLLGGAQREPIGCRYGRANIAVWGQRVLDGGCHLGRCACLL